MAKKRKQRRVPMRFRKNDPAHNLLAAVTHWVRANGGDLAMVGGIGILPNWHEHKFQVCVGCLGRKPTVEKSKAVP